MKPLAISTLNKVRTAVESLVFDMCRAINNQAIEGRRLPNVAFDQLNQIDALLHCVIARIKIALGEYGPPVMHQEPDILERLRRAERRLLIISDHMNSDDSESEEPEGEAAIRIVLGIDEDAGPWDTHKIGFFRRDQLQTTGEVSNGTD